MKYKIKPKRKLKTFPKKSPDSEIQPATGLEDLSSERQMGKFLSRIHWKCRGQLEIRCIDPNTGCCTKFWPDDEDEAMEIISIHKKTRNIYVGVCTRKDSSTGTKENLSTYPGVWMDIDFKDFHGGEKEAIERLHEFSLSPTMVVHSGGGLHAYWLLELPRRVTPQNLQKFEELNRSFAKILNGDMAATELAHLMRIPGTINFPNSKKQKAGRTTGPVRLLALNENRYRLKDLQSYCPQESSDHEGKNDGGSIQRFQNLLRTDAKIGATWNGTRTDLRDASRSGYDMAMANLLVRHDFSDSEILTFLRDMPSGRRDEAKEEYLARTIAKARQANPGILNTTQPNKTAPPYIAEQFLQEQGLITSEGLELRYYQERWWQFDGRIFHHTPDENFNAQVTNFIRSTPAKVRATTGFLKNVTLHLQGLCHLDTTVQLPVLQDDQGLVPQTDVIVLQNGILDLNMLDSKPSITALRKHTPGFIGIICLPYEYNPTAQCPLWMKTLCEILPNYESRILLQEIFGYALISDTSFQKFFYFEGPGGNGKSLVLNVLTALVGEQNVFNLPLESFGDPHGLEGILGKLLNIVIEVNNLDAVAEGRLKQFTGNDVMHFNPKYKQSFKARPTARLIIAANVRPHFKDRSEGIWRRLIVLPFPVRIKDIKVEDTQLGKELLPELSGIFNWSLEGLFRLRANGAFTIPKESAEAVKEFQLEGNPAKMFLKEFVKVDREATILVTELYQKYKVFCDNHGYHPLNDAHFGREVSNIFPGIKKQRTKNNKRNQRPYYYPGLRMEPVHTRL